MVPTSIPPTGVPPNLLRGISDDVLKRRARLQQWTLWQCDLPTLARMQAEVTQELGKLELALVATEREFNQFVTAGDPLGADQMRLQAAAIGRKWDMLRRRGGDIDVVMRQKQLDQRVVALGMRFGISDLPALLRTARILLLAISVIAVSLTLLPGVAAATVASLDTINLVCSLLLFSEFAFRLALVTGRGVYFRNRAFAIFLSLPLVTLASPIPDLATIARLITLMRVGRLVRLITGERREAVVGGRFLRSPEFILLQRAALTALALVALGAAVLRVLEGAGDQPFTSFSENLWWGIKIILTGNIDQNPTTLLGRLVTIGIVVIGVSVTSILIATITAVLVNLSSEANDLERQQEDMTETLSTMRGQLDLLTNARQAAAEAAVRIHFALVSAQRDFPDLVQQVVESLVREFGCLQASIHQIDESTREVVLEVSAGQVEFQPERRITMDAGLVGRVASAARRGSSGALPEWESEPLPLADGAAIAIPLFVRSQWRGQRRVLAEGVLHVVVPQAWLRDELLKLLLADVSVSLAQFLHSTEASERHSALLANISDLQTTMERVTTTLDYEKLLFAIAEGATALIDAEMSKVMLLDRDGHALRGVAWHGMGDDLGSSLATPVGEGLSGLCARTGNPVKSSNLLTDQRVTASSSQALRSGMRSELCVPIRSRGAVRGVLCVMSRANKRFSQEEETLLGTLAGQAGAAIDNAQAYRLVQRQLRIADSMQAISQKLSESTEETETLAWILAQIGDIVDHTSASVFLVEGDWMRLAAASGFPPGVLPDDLRFALAEHRLFARLADGHLPLIIADTADDPDWLHGPTEIRSWIGVPMRVEGTLIGLLSLDHVQPNAFSEADAAIAARYAVQAALAVRTARLYTALRD